MQQTVAHTAGNIHKMQKHIFVFGVEFVILGFGYFGDVVLFSGCLNNGFFKSRFQQSAKDRMTASTVESYHVFVKLSGL